MTVDKIVSYLTQKVAVRLINIVIMMNPVLVHVTIALYEFK